MLAMYLRSPLFTLRIGEQHAAVLAANVHGRRTFVVEDDLKLVRVAQVVETREQFAFGGSERAVRAAAHAGRTIEHVDEAVSFAFQAVHAGAGFAAGKRDRPPLAAREVAGAGGQPRVGLTDAREFIGLRQRRADIDRRFLGNQLAHGAAGRLLFNLVFFRRWFAGCLYDDGLLVVEQFAFIGDARAGNQIRRWRRIRAMQLLASHKAQDQDQQRMQQE